MNNATNRTHLVDCPKCDGRGRIEAFSSTERGKCFTCGGAKKISANHVSVAKQLQANASCWVWRIKEAVQYDEYVSPLDYERTAESLLALNDSAKARGLLNMLKGEHRQRVIDAGRRLKAA